MLLFYKNKILQIFIVIVIWLVLNYKYLLLGVIKNIENNGKFGFYFQILFESLFLYQNDIEMGYIVEFKIFLLNVDYYVIFVFRKEDKMD